MPSTYLRLLVEVTKLAAVRGAGSRAVKAELFGQRNGNGLLTARREFGAAVTIPLVSTYKHLGAQQLEGSLSSEVRYRVGQAKAAFHEGRRKIYLAHILNALVALVISRLTQGAGSWPELPRKDRQVLDTATAIWQLYRFLLCVPRGAPQNHTALSVYALTDLPPLAMLLRKCRLQYLCQLVRSGPDVLWAAIRADRGYADLLSADARWMHAWICRTSDLPHPASDWNAWCDLMRSQPGRYKGLLKRACRLDQLRLRYVASLDGLCRFAGSAVLGPVQLQRDVPLVTPGFRDRVSWAGHAAAARCHGYRSRAHLLAKGSVCLACRKQFATQGRLRRHLTDVPDCVRNWGAFVPAEADRTSRSVHRLAPTSLAEGVLMILMQDALGASLESGADDRVCAALREALEHLHDVEEDVVWACITEHIEPLAVLRATVCSWRADHDDSMWHREASENMLLLLDPDVSADTFPNEAKTSKLPQDLTPVWAEPKGIGFVVSGCLQEFTLPSPPPLSFAR